MSSLAVENDAFSTLHEDPRRLFVASPRNSGLTMSKSGVPHGTKFALSFVVLFALQVAGCGSPESRAKSYYDDGMKLLASKNYQTASIEFRNAVKIKKDMIPAWRGLAETEEATQHWDVLVPVLRTILELDPKDDATRMKLARLLVAGGAMDQALKLANEINDPDNANAGLLALKAAIYYKLKDEDTAVRDASAAIKIEPGNVDALIVLAADRLANDDPQGALKLLSGAAASNADNVSVQLLKINIYRQLKDYPQLENVLKSLAERFPQDATLRKQLVGLYMFEHRPDDAEKELRATAAANPGNSESGLDLMRFLYETKGPAVARDELVARINAGMA